MRRVWDDLVLAAMLLARIPVPRGWQPAELPPLARGVWSYPVIGALLGLLGGAVFALARALGMPPVLAAGWTLAAMLLAGGGLHEDGLADTADGFGGGRDRERKLAIMRDSRIGSYGVLALLLSIGLRGAALAALAEPRVVLPALVASGALGRAAILLVLRLVPPARPDGLAAALGRPGWRAVAPGLALAAAAALLCLPPGRALAALLLAACCAAATAWLARQQVGGQTGDVLGATDQLAECAVLTLLVSG